jgi:hypothetical protein
VTGPLAADRGRFERNFLQAVVAKDEDYKAQMIIFLQQTSAKGSVPGVRGRAARRDRRRHGPGAERGFASLDRHPSDNYEG